MRVIGIGLGAAVILAAAVAAQPQRAPAMSFDDDKPGGPPPGFTFAPWRQPAAGTWAIRRQAANGYLWHEADATATGYSIALAPGPAFRDVSVTARLRLAGGSRAGGLVWRYQDEQNYYGVVLDLTQGRLTLLRVATGNRVFLEVEDDLQLDVDAWHTLRVVHDDDEVRVSLGGIRVFEESDRRGGRTAAGGRTGVLAHGNAEVWIDDLRIEEDRGRQEASELRERAGRAERGSWGPASEPVRGSAGAKPPGLR